MTDHAANAAEAKRLYVASLTPKSFASDWADSKKVARGQISAALRASSFLQDISAALQESGAHMTVFRQLLAPPVSQDQFKLICKEWSKASENSGSKVKQAVSKAIATQFEEWRDRLLTKWLDTGRRPSRLELRRIFITVEPLLASQLVTTARRNRLSAAQERSVTDLLDRLGWVKMTVRSIKNHSMLPPKHYAHKVLFSTQTTPQEVDIACGLRNTVVLGMECKVTNDATNSIKRINDVLKKARAWQQHYGSFVQTAALLQGVINPNDVERLVSENVRVFWSHDLKAFEQWLATQV